MVRWWYETGLGKVHLRPNQFWLRLNSPDRPFHGPFPRAARSSRRRVANAFSERRKTMRQGLYVVYYFATSVPDRALSSGNSGKCPAS